MNYLADFFDQQDHLSDLYNQFNKDQISLLDRIYNTDDFDILISHLLLSYDITDIINHNKYNDKLFTIIFNYNKYYNNFYGYHLSYACENNIFDYINNILDYSENNPSHNKELLNNHCYIYDFINTDESLKNLCDYFNNNNKIIKTYVDKFIFKDNIKYLDMILDIAIRLNNKDIINYIKTLIISEYGLLYDLIPFLDLLKNKNLLTDHYLSEIIKNLKDDFDISIVLNDYVTNILDVIIYLNHDYYYSNIKYVCEIALKRNLYLDQSYSNNNFAEGTFGDNLVEFVIRSDYYNPIFHDIISSIIFDSIYNNDYLDKPQDYIIYFIKHIYESLIPYKKTIIKDKLILDDKIFLDKVIENLYYHELFHKEVYDYIKIKISIYNELRKDHYFVHNYILYYIKYFNDDSYDIKDLLLSNELIIYRIITSGHIYNYDKFINIHNLLDQYIYEYVINNIKKFIENKKLLFNVCNMLSYTLYYYKDKIEEFDKYIKINNEFAKEFISKIYNNNILFKYYYDLDDNDIIYQDILNNKLNNQIIMYYLRYYKNDNNINIKNKILLYLNENKYNNIDYDNNLIKDYIIKNRNYINNNLFTIDISNNKILINYIEKYDKRSKLIDKYTNLPQDIINIIYDYIYITTQ